ncbi:gpW family head-tail joining protein [Labrys wisconsinensis]|uniref:House-cleaning NTP pyrophosphatase (Maf/HAM1 superfamily) n=1 Tax=Labrys wisconsinensis TaxID=425677 RepID=A0ABU0JEW0_9HYPH|nr:gpW family head-tail joining protein [Labrys wisconsinensis]MDQ0472806.1 putative house-cleaning NTP pyrophosphatase (Maf/HAM1 superfamily) [Labrys wisconsinensis]
MTTAEMLEQARAVLHRLLTGAAVVELDVEGRRTKFTPMNRSDLEAYIKRLEAQLGACPPPGAIGVIF